jgi:hypothetical protein
VGLNGQPHRNQLGNKMIKSEGNNMGKVEDMHVIGRGREMTWSGKIKKNTKQKKLTSAKRGHASGLPWCAPIEKIMTDKAFEEYWWLKNKGIWGP